MKKERDNKKERPKIECLLILNIYVLLFLSIPSSFLKKRYMQQETISLKLFSISKTIPT